MLRFPTLGGEMDFAVLPRELGDSGSKLGRPEMFLPAVETRVANFSGVAAEAVAFLRDARDLPSGVAAFDAAYQVFVLPGENSALADRAWLSRSASWIGPERQSIRIRCWPGEIRSDLCSKPACRRPRIGPPSRILSPSAKNCASHSLHPRFHLRLARSLTA